MFLGFKASHNLIITADCPFSRILEPSKRRAVKFILYLSLEDNKFCLNFWVDVTWILQRSTGIGDDVALTGAFLILAFLVSISNILVERLVSQVRTRLIVSVSRDRIPRGARAQPLHRHVQISRVGLGQPDVLDRRRASVFDC